MLLLDGRPHYHVSWRQSSTTQQALIYVESTAQDSVRARTTSLARRSRAVAR